MKKLKKKKKLIEMERMERERKRKIIEGQLEQARLESSRKIQENRDTLQRRQDIEKEISNRNQQRTVKPKPQRIVQVRQERRREREIDYEDELLGEDDPFICEEEIDYEVARQYKSRNSLIFGKDLPVVSFKKGKKSGDFIIGQRRFKVENVNGELKVIIGKTMRDFMEFIEHQERIQSLKAKALKSAGYLVTFC